MLRRRRAAGGPAEQIFSTLVGLELRPRRSRDAATLWALIAAQGGPDARDGVWDHPDLLPSPLDLDDPAGYQTRRTEVQEEQSDLDKALADIFSEAEGSQGPGPSEPTGPTDDTETEPDGSPRD